MSTADRVIPPREGHISVLALTGTTASAATDVGASGQHIFICDKPFYITFFGAQGEAEEPDETAVTGSSRTMLWPASFPLAVWISGINDSRFRVKPTGDSHLRWWKG